MISTFAEIFKIFLGSVVVNFVFGGMVYILAHLLGFQLSSGAAVLIAGPASLYTVFKFMGEV